MRVLLPAIFAAAFASRLPSVPAPDGLFTYTHYPGKNAYTEHGGVELDNNSYAPIHLTVDECLGHCFLTPLCECVVFQPTNGECWAYADCDPSAFTVNPHFDVYVRQAIVTTKVPTTATVTTTTTTFTATTITTTTTTTLGVTRVADAVTLGTIAAAMFAGMAIYVKVGRIAAVSQQIRSWMLLALGLFHCAGQFIPWVAFSFHGVDCQRGMPWTVHIFYAVLLALAAPFLGGVYIGSVARGKLPLLGWRGLPFLVFSYCTTVVNGIDTYSDSLITAKALRCAQETSGLGILAVALLVNFWAGMAVQVLTLGFMGHFGLNGSTWRGFKWALLTLADVLPHSHARAQPEAAAALAPMDNAEVQDPSRCIKGVEPAQHELDSWASLGFSLGVDADAKVFAQTLILVRLVTEDLPQPILQFLLGERVGFGYDVCLSMVSAVLLSMYGIFELIAEGSGEDASDGFFSSSTESSEDESSPSESEGTLRKNSINSTP